MVTPAVRREAVAHLQVTYQVSERRACSALGADRASMRYRSLRPDDLAVRTRLRELASVRRRFGYRRLHILLRREGIVMNHKKLRGLYREERLQVRRRSSRKRAVGTRAPMALPQGPNQRWSLDFLSDAFADGRRFPILAIVDDFTRECLALGSPPAASSMPSATRSSSAARAPAKPIYVSPLPRRSFAPALEEASSIWSISSISWSRRRPPDAVAGCPRSCCATISSSSTNSATCRSPNPAASSCSTSSAGSTSARPSSVTTNLSFGEWPSVFGESKLS